MTIQCESISDLINKISIDTKTKIKVILNQHFFFLFLSDLLFCLIRYLCGV